MRDKGKWSTAFHDFLAVALQKVCDDDQQPFDFGIRRTGTSHNNARHQSHTTNHTRQDPADRPTAPSLLQHPFVVGQMTSHAAALVPLLGQVQAYLASKVGAAVTPAWHGQPGGMVILCSPTSIKSTAPNTLKTSKQTNKLNPNPNPKVTPASTLRSSTSAGSGRRRDAAGSHTGQFSWGRGAAGSGGGGAAGGAAAAAAAAAGGGGTVVARRSGAGGGDRDRGGAYSTVVEREGGSTPLSAATRRMSEATSGWGQTVVAVPRFEAGDTVAALTPPSATPPASGAAATAGHGRGPGGAFYGAGSTLPAGAGALSSSAAAAGGGGGAQNTLAAALASARRMMAEAAADEPSPGGDDYTPESSGAGTERAADDGAPFGGAAAGGVGCSVRQQQRDAFVVPATATRQQPQPFGQPQGDVVEEEEGSYMMALKSAAADREREQYPRGGGAARTPSPGRRAQGSAEGLPSTATRYSHAPGAGAGSGSSAAASDRAAVSGGTAVSAAAAAAAAAEERLRAQLRAAYDGGLVVPLPFLSAATAAPLALFNAPHSPHVTPHGLRGGVQGIDAEAHRVVSQLVREVQAAERGLPSLHHLHPKQQQQQQQGGGRYPQRDAQAAWSRTDQHRADPSAIRVPPEPLPPAVLAKLLQNPALQNCARCLGYWRAALEALPLERDAAEGAARAAEGMAAALKTVLCSALY